MSIVPIPPNTGADCNPYAEWLGISPSELHPNYYQLLGIDAFESNPNVIKLAYEKRFAQLKRHAIGKHSDLSQRILNEIATAKVTLSSEPKKAIYDQLLKQQIDATTPPAVSSSQGSELSVGLEISAIRAKRLLLSEIADSWRTLLLNQLRRIAKFDRPAIAVCGFVVISLFVCAALGVVIAFRSRGPTTGLALTPNRSTQSGFATGGAAMPETDLSTTTNDQANSSAQLFAEREAPIPPDGLSIDLMEDVGPLGDLTDSNIDSLNTGDDQGLTTNDLETFSVPNEYIVVVTTGTIEKAGTDAGVFLTLYGRENQSQEFALDTLGVNDFERGSVNQFAVTPSLQLGDVTAIRLRHNNGGRAPGWYVLRVHITSPEGKGYEVDCNQWLAVTTGDRRIDRVFQVKSN